MNFEFQYGPPHAENLSYYFQNLTKLPAVLELLQRSLTKAELVNTVINDSRLHAGNRNC